MPCIKINFKEKILWLKQDTSLTQLDEWIPFGCRAGACGICVIKVLSGKQTFGSMHEDEAIFLNELGFDAEQYRLACQCRLKHDAEIEICSN